MIQAGSQSIALVLAWILPAAPSATAQSIDSLIATLDGELTIVEPTPEVMKLNQSYRVVARLRNTGTVPLPGLPPVDRLSGRPCLYVGWGFTKKDHGAFAFLGTAALDAPLPPGASIDFDMEITTTRDQEGMRYLRVGLWVSRKESAGLVGGPVGEPLAIAVDLPSDRRPATRVAFYGVIVLAHLLFFGYLVMDFRQCRRESRAARVPVTPTPPAADRP